MNKMVLHRLMKEEKSLDEDPVDHAVVVRDGNLDFHFLIYGLDEPLNGHYHAELILSQNYPFSPPKLIFFTPNGRFLLNTPICTSFTNFHPEQWTCAWNVRSLIQATISFLCEETSTYGSMAFSKNDAAKLAQKSIEFNLKNEKFCRLFGDKLMSLGDEFQIQKKHLQEIEKKEKENQIEKERPIKLQKGNGLNKARIFFIVSVIGLFGFCCVYGVCKIRKGNILSITHKTPYLSGLSRNLTNNAKKHGSIQII